MVQPTVEDIVNMLEDLISEHFDSRPQSRVEISSWTNFVDIIVREHDGARFDPPYDFRITVSQTELEMQGKA